MHAHPSGSSVIHGRLSDLGICKFPRAAGTPTIQLVSFRCVTQVGRGRSVLRPFAESQCTIANSTVWLAALCSELVRPVDRAKSQRTKTLVAGLPDLQNLQTQVDLGTLCHPGSTAVNGGLMPVCSTDHGKHDSGFDPPSCPAIDPSYAGTFDLINSILSAGQHIEQRLHFIPAQTSTNQRTMWTP